MTTIEDTVAAHIDTNWNEDGGNNPKPVIDNKLDAPLPETLEDDNVIILPAFMSNARILSDNSKMVVTHVPIQIVSKTTNGSTSTFKDRLKQLIDEVIHVLDHKNHAISGYYEHFAEVVEHRAKPMGESDFEALNKADITLTLYEIVSR